jgi:hypothetical protein
MKDVGHLLRDADPLAPGAGNAHDVEDNAPGLSPAGAQLMRRAMLAALDERRLAVAHWPTPLAIAATIALALAMGFAIGRQLPPRGAMDMPAVARVGASPEVGGRRQLQFATPGGTRVIWVFNPDFEP